MYLIDKGSQEIIAKMIDESVKRILGSFVSHDNEEALTSVLGQALMERPLDSENLSVSFNYRQHNKITEEKFSGADGGFVVTVITPDGVVEKATLFQAKLLRGEDNIRSLVLSKSEGKRLKKQSQDMLTYTKEAVALFYTHKNIYVVDATDYMTSENLINPLSDSHRLITLGTYLGKWMTRCTKGDRNSDFLTRVKHKDGFKNSLSLDVISRKPSVSKETCSEESAWRKR